MMTTAIKEHPILFSGPMVRAILDGRKTVTRRVVTSYHDFGGGGGRGGSEWNCAAAWGHEDQYGDWVPLTEYRCPYGRPGDRLWVRETWRLTCDTDAVCCVAYRADGAALHYLCDNGGEGDPTELAGPAGKLWDEDAAKWRPSIHMPRWASRITLEVVSVRVERLPEITEEDAEAEGFERREHFIRLWDKLNAKHGHDFASNPWVWRVEFKKLEDSK